MFKIVIPFVVTVLSLSALASTGGARQSVNFMNPNGCRVFDMVVEPKCPNGLTLNQCESGAKVVKLLNQQLKADGLKAKCSRLHTGSTSDRLFQETVMNSPSYDGIRLAVTLKSAPESVKNSSRVVTDDPEVCAKTAQVLLALGLKANCDNDAVSVGQ